MYHKIILQCIHGQHFSFFYINQSVLHRCSFKVSYINKKKIRHLIFFLKNLKISHIICQIPFSGIVSRASANGQLYEEDELENDSLSQNSPHSAENNNKKRAWEPPSTTMSQQTGITTITCANGSVTNVGVNGASSNLVASDTMGSSENNLTVYF